MFEADAQQGRALLNWGHVLMLRATLAAEEPTVRPSVATALSDCSLDCQSQVHLPGCSPYQLDVHGLFPMQGAQVKAYSDPDSVYCTCSVRRSCW